MFFIVFIFNFWLLTYFIFELKITSVSNTAL
nr:MAG TPA: hypothetical protein [Caudoviricetes sp.]